MKIEYRKIDELKERFNNPRTRTKRQVEQIAASITRIGYTQPVLADDEDILIAGHGRVAAARMLGMTEIPTIRISGLSEADIRAYVIADNKICMNAGFDPDLLRIEMAYLSNLAEDYDLKLTGFEWPEIDALLADPPAKAEKADRLDKVPPASTGPAVTRPGDLWLIGEHKLMCGSALANSSYVALMGQERATLIFTDPPYNVPIAGHVSGLGKVQHAEFAMASGEMSRDEFRSFLLQFLIELGKASVNGSIHCICMDWRHVEDLQAAAVHAYHELKNICVWVKTNAGMGSLYRSAHEFVFVYKYGTEPHINNVELGRQPGADLRHNRPPCGSGDQHGFG